MVRVYVVVYLLFINFILVNINILINLIGNSLNNIFEKM